MTTNPKRVNKNDSFFNASLRQNSAKYLDTYSDSYYSYSFSRSDQQQNSRELKAPFSERSIPSLETRDSSYRATHIGDSSIYEVSADDKFYNRVFLSLESVGAEGAYHNKLKKIGKSGGKDLKRNNLELIPAANDDTLLQTRLPVRSVLDYVNVKQHASQLRNELLWYIPFLVLFTMFALWGSGDARQIHLNESSLRRKADISLHNFWNKHSSIMKESFKLDSESNPSNASTPIIPGGSSYPWMYTNYNETVNAWTPQPNISAAVDEQVYRISESYQNPNFVNLWSIRTKRDLMRWLINAFVPQNWDCINSDYKADWLSLRGGSQRMIGAVRLTTRRRMADNKCRRKELKGLVSCQASGNSGAYSHPDLTPELFCNLTNPAFTNETLFTFNDDEEGYNVHLPFTSSCSSILSALSIFETPKQNVDSGGGKSYVMMSELWDKFQMDTDNASACSSFLFHRSVAEFSIEYVVYAPGINSFMYATTHFEFEATGSTTFPKMRIYTSPVWSAKVHFTKLALSIVLMIYLLYYFFYLCRMHVHRCKTIISGMKQLQKTNLARVSVILHQFCHLWSLFLWLAIIFTFADLIVSWWMWGQAQKHSLIEYKDREAFPEAIARYCKVTAPLHSNLLSAACFFTYLSAIRFSTLFTGIWVLLETIYFALDRLLGIVGIWMLLSVGMAICGMLVFGEISAEFSTFSQAYGTILLMYIDRGKWLFTGKGWDSSTTGFDTTVPSTKGVLLGENKEFVQGYKRQKMFLCSTSVYQLFYYTYNFLFIFLVGTWTVGILSDSYQQIVIRNGAMLQGAAADWQMLIGSIYRSFSFEYLTEWLRRLLWARREALLYLDIETAIKNSAALNGTEQSSSKYSYDDENKMTFTALLWILPRELQAEFGPSHLRKFWQGAADYVRYSQKQDTKAINQQWRRYWEKCEDGIQGWLVHVVPPEVELERKATEVGILLEELPPRIVKYVEKYGESSPSAHYT